MSEGLAEYTVTSIIEDKQEKRKLGWRWDNAIGGAVAEKKLPRGHILCIDILRICPSVLDLFCSRIYGLGGFGVSAIITPGHKSSAILGCREISVDADQVMK